MSENKTIFISADHGLSVVYFLQTGVLPTLLEAGVRVVLLTDDGLKEQIQARFAQPGLVVEGLRFQECRRYFEGISHSLQYWIHFLRWMGGSDRINTNAMDGHLRQMGYEASPRGKRIMPLIRALTSLLRRSRLARRRWWTRSAASPRRPLRRPLRKIPALPGGRQHARLALGPLPAARGRRPRDQHRGGDRRLGQPPQLPPARRAGRLDHLLVGDPEARAGAGLGLGPRAGQHRRDPLLRRLFPHILADAARGVLSPCTAWTRRASCFPMRAAS